MKITLTISRQLETNVQMIKNTFSEIKKPAEILSAEMMDLILMKIVTRTWTFT